MTKLSESNQSHWIPLSDLMTGMMLVFMMIAMIYMVKVQQVATDLKDTKGKIYQALEKEFSKDLKKWDAEILPNLTIRFKNPNSLFEKGDSNLKGQFKGILDDFIPRYFRIIRDKKYDETIKEILIEGHTDADFEVLDFEDAKKLKVDLNIKRYMNNMWVSNERTWNTLSYLFEMYSDDSLTQEYIMKKIHPHELSSSMPIYDQNGLIDKQSSRRVEFKIISNAEERLEEIAEKLTTK